MGRYDDYTGVANTCPKINKVLDGLDGLVEFVSGYVGNEECMEAIVKDVLQYKETLKEIRTMNQLLRDFGNEKAKEFDEIEKERDSLQNDISDLRQELSSKESQIRELEQDINVLEENIDTLITENNYLARGGY